MKKLFLLTLLMSLVIVGIYADTYVTANDGTKYTLEKLSAIEGSGVTRQDKVYTMTESVTVSEKDTFCIESGVTLKMASGVQLRIEGTADFEAAERVLITRNAEDDTPKGIYMCTDLQVTKFKNIDFEYAGLRNFGAYGLDIDNCTFRYNNGKQSSAGALAVGSDGACFNITNCTFEYNTVPGIGGGANFTNGVVIDNCKFIDNNTKNANKPQLNLTVGGNNDIVVSNCTFTGAQRTKVGAIAVSNMMGLSGTNKTTIENNDIRGHRYGITTLGAQTVTIKNNTIVDNQYETNAVNGGSGISIYDSNGLQTVTITGNYIEKNLWGITIIGGKSINIGKTEDPNADDYNPGKNVFKDNGNNGVLYDLYNNSANTVYAQGNHWNVDEQTAEKIETVIFHKNDDSTLGEVIYMPAMDDASNIKTLHSQGVKIANGKITLSDAATIDVYAMDGKHIGRFSTSGGSIDLSMLAKGTYITRIKTAKGCYAVKFSL